MELLVVGLRPARENILLLEFLMPDERANDSGGYAKPRIRYIVTGQQDVHYKHYSLGDRGPSHLAPGPQDTLQIPAERLASLLFELRYAGKQDLREAGAAALPFDELDKFLVYLALGGAHASGEQLAAVSLYLYCNRCSGTPQAKQNIARALCCSHAPPQAINSESKGGTSRGYKVFLYSTPEHRADPTPNARAVQPLVPLSEDPGVSSAPPLRARAAGETPLCFMPCDVCM